MTKSEPPREPQRDPLAYEDEEADGGPPRVPLGDWLRFALGALRRRWLVASAVFLAGMSAAALYYRFKSPVYRVEAKILAQRQGALLSGRPGGDDHPARSAWELIHRRDNLVALAQETGLLEGGPIEEPPSLATRVLNLIRPPAEPQKEEPIDALVRVLDKRLLVTVDEGTILLQLDWPEPRQAYHVVQAALQGFLEARHLQEVQAIDDVIAKLEGRTARLKAELDSALEQARRRAPAPVRPLVARERGPSEELVRLRSLSEAKTRAARDVEEFRTRRLAELESQLTQARASLSEAHPTVVALKRDIEALDRESPHLRALRDEERRVHAEYAALLAREGNPIVIVPSPDPITPDAGAAREEDPKVRDLRLQYEQLVSRVTAARIDLDSARAAFKYRYNVIWPPEVPAEPRSPSPPRIFGAGLLLALLLAVAAAALPDLLAGRVVERWQVERELDLTVLAEAQGTDRRSR